MRRCVLLVLATLSPPITLAGQDQAPRFDVVSVKVNRQDNGLISIGTRGSQFQATGVPLGQLIQQAFRVQGDQIVGGPDWLDRDRFDIVATFTPDRIPNFGPGGPPCIRPPGGGPDAPCLPPIDPDGPALETAMQEQLGLKLDNQRGPVDVLIIESAEHPIED